MSFTQEQVALLDADPGAVEAIRLLEVQFASQTVRLAEGVLPFEDSSGVEWAPGLGLIETPSIDSGDPLEAVPAIYRLGRVTPDLHMAAIHQRHEWQDRPIRFWLQILSDRQPVGPAISLHRGRIRQITQRWQFGSMTLEVRAEGLLAARNHTPLGHYTDRDQQRRSPGDRGCEYRPSFLNKVITGWLRT